MAHKYSNFDDAFNDLKNKFAAAKLANERALTNARAAFTGSSDPVDKTHFGYATYAIEQLTVAFNNLADLTENAWDRSHLYESIYWGNKDIDAPPEYELTYAKIVEAWAKDDFKGAAATIAFIDRMRQLIWDEPFSVVWASKPEEQEL